MSTRPSLEDTLAEVVTWQMETFPHATPRSQVEHLRREVLELVGDMEQRIRELTEDVRAAREAHAKGGRGP